MLKKINIIGIVLVAMLIAVGIAGATSNSGDQGRRLSGPFCVGKTNAGVNAGVVRSVSKGQACRSYEIAKTGVAVPCKSVTVKLVPTNPCEVAKGVPGIPGAAGPKGADGAKGATGATGSQGAAGANGTPGAKGDTGSAGATGEKGDTGATGAVGPQGQPGSAGATGATGAQGIQGVAGPQGPKGDKGDAGLGNGFIYACVSNGGTVQFNVNGKPCDNNGHTTQLKLVVVTP